MHCRINTCGSVTVEDISIVVCHAKMCRKFPTLFLFALVVNLSVCDLNKDDLKSFADAFDSLSDKKSNKANDKVSSFILSECSIHAHLLRLILFRYLILFSLLHSIIQIFVTSALGYLLFLNSNICYLGMALRLCYHSYLCLCVSLFGSNPNALHEFCKMSQTYIFNFVMDLRENLRSKILK